MEGSGSETLQIGYYVSGGPRGKNIRIWNTCQVFQLLRKNLVSIITVTGNILSDPHHFHAYMYRIVPYCDVKWTKHIS
jgi:hypothetical protein